MLNIIRNFLTNFQWYINLRQIMREGLLNAFKRKVIQGRILSTRPFNTATSGEIEVRVLTWRKDYINLIWALKTFYFTAQVDYPLYIHDGGLNKKGKKTLKYHFPNAIIIDKSFADKEINTFFDKNSLHRSKEYRSQNIATVKLFDYFILSSAKRIISIDSDIIFYQHPLDIISKTIEKNIYNRDCQFGYSLSINSIKKKFNLTIPSHINSGLFNVSKDIFDANQIEEWLKDDELFDNKWVTEQTLHAMLSQKHKDGAHLLNDDYIVSTSLGLKDSTICKHYPGFFRPFFYQEGMVKLYNSDIFPKLL